eukprot:CAMPEP_0194725840 /NCGR_PEP_ID=MMETSP0296-20130528/28598_1 /TAXON_ID=39354 /ORGANISM="Heterosigma akashiwo, Strain CCMP2393" /LENGTH=223 /DNA_ID=CAMNT_0039630525 /DNA_START=249 /DNA_END=921 /DNA_ORIENTATION=-
MTLFLKNNSTAAAKKTLLLTLQEPTQQQQQQQVHHLLLPQPFQRKKEEEEEERKKKEEKRRSTSRRRRRPLLLVDPVEGGRRVVAQLRLVEPEADLALGVLHGVRPVADVPPHLNAVVTTDGARVGFQGVGGPKHLAASSHHTLAFPDHRAHRTRQHVRLELREEGLLHQLVVVRLQQLLVRLAQLHGHQLEALLLEALDYLAHEAPLDAIGLDHDVGALHVH